MTTCSFGHHSVINGSALNSGKTVIRSISGGEGLAGMGSAEEMSAGELVVDALFTVGTIAGSVVGCRSLTSCSVSCVDLTIDPQNCGNCARTCVIHNATAICVDGQCQLDQCVYSYLDVDQNLR